MDRLVDLFKGETSPENLIAVAATDDELAKTHHYIGGRAPLDGQAAKQKKPSPTASFLSAATSLDRILPGRVSDN